MYPNWLQVEYAITLFKSFCSKPVVAAKNAVHAPRIATIFKDTGLYSNTGELLVIKKTPAVTIVAAWINAETGVGPSIASGSQECKPNCADLPTAPIKSKIPIIVKQLISVKK